MEKVLTKYGIYYCYNSSEKTLTLSPAAPDTRIGNLIEACDLPEWLHYVLEIEKVVLEDGITRIVDHAFQGCRNLKEVQIPDSVTSIGGWAFVDCSALTKLTIPDSVKSIGLYAFAGCGNLEELHIPDGADVAPSLPDARDLQRLAESFSQYVEYPDML